MGEEKQETPDVEGDKSDDEPNGRGLDWRSAWAPITGMVVFILITVSISLFVAPLYISQGMQAFSEEDATNPLIAVYYLVMIIVVTTIILLLKKFLKRRKRNILKYVLAAAVLFSTYAVVSPVLDVVVNGMPEEWEVQDLEVEDPYWALPIGIDEEKPSMMVFENGSLSLLRYQDEGYEVYAKETQVDQLIPIAISNISTKAGNTYTYLAAMRSGNEVHMVDLGDGGDGSQGNDITYSIHPFNIPENGSLLDATRVCNYFGSNLDLYIISNGTGSEIYGMVNGNLTIFHRSDEESFKFSFGSGVPVVYTRNEIFFITFDNGSMELDKRPSAPENIQWIRSFGEKYLVGTENALHWWMSDGQTVSIFNKRILSPYLVWLSEEEDGYEIMAMRGNNLYVFNINYFGHSTWYMDDYDYLMVYEDKPGGTLTIVSSEKIERGTLSETGDSLFVELCAFGFAIGVVGILLWKPKWWIVDLSGILMGAGVLTLIGISISILPILLLLILLAVYDFISVYKTKHMLALAESVVEAKLPILLVFPLKWGYRYEDETNLLDKSRPREAMFMGLGDVIIPGSLLISAYTFLPSDGIELLGMISPQLSVAMFSLVGMLIALLFLMYQVLKGKAHAGLPFLNGGVILGFLLGELIIYGTIII